MNKFIEIKPEISAALKEKRAVVALESTLIAHGMPYPQNLETARLLEAAIRDNGAIPATIAILGGKIKVGLKESELELLAGSPNVLKVSRRDMSYIIAQKLHGATTVAATLIIADMVGIQVFATGGIGGVHREGQNTLDISADLPELSRSKVAVISAGAKAILDLGLTLEYLETLGVPVIGYQTDDFPAFYTRKSGFKLECQADRVSELANIVHCHWALGLGGGLLIANPIPEDYQMDEIMTQTLIQKAIREAEQNQITGKDLTPFLLAHTERLSSGKSLEANIQLVLNNARLGAQLAVLLAEVN
ncbi:MAG: pseudouridine-5'-phosphate glycosidase [Microscillaceae bacterium]|nr:pseudouridine-5'-phosphate glycosidase [Microscillaceae bacterium]